MPKTTSIESSRRDMVQRDSVELCRDTGRQVPTCSPISSAGMHSPLRTHIDTGGIEGAIMRDRGEGDIGDGAGGQQRPALAAQRQPDGHGHPEQAGQAAQAAAGAQRENHPFLQETREEAAQRAGLCVAACPGSLLGTVPERGDVAAVHVPWDAGHWVRGRGGLTRAAGPR